MDVATPHYLLFSQASHTRGVGHWQFVLRSADGSEQIQAADVEPDAHGQRLELLTVVRALESLDQPSHVTLMGCSKYVLNGMQYGLPEWQANGWRWECFGQMVPVKNFDLWQRLERALRFHRVECCRRRFDGPHTLSAPPVAGKGDRHLMCGQKEPVPISRQPAPPAGEAKGQVWGFRVKVSDWLKYLHGGLRAYYRSNGKYSATH